MSEKGGALSISMHGAFELSNYPPSLVVAKELPFHWFAIQTKARHEKKVNSELREKGIQSFLPLHRERRRWSDRSQWVELPMFSQYLFVRVPENPDSRVRVLQTGGVIQFVGTSGRGTPVPDEQVENLAAIVSHCIPTAPHEFLQVGRRVRIRSGVLEGIEGILSAIKNEKHFVVSVDLIQKSVAIQINGFDVEPA